MRLFFAVFLLFSGCASLRYQSPGPYEGGPVIGSGTYLAEVVVQPGTGPSKRFTGLFSRKPFRGFSLFTALSTAGKPLFRARDSLRVEDKVLLEFFPSELSPELLAQFYEGIRPLVLLDDDPRKPQPLVIERHQDLRPHTLALPGGPTLQINEYDWEAHAFRLRIVGRGFTAEVTLRQYQI